MRAWLLLFALTRPPSFRKIKRVIFDTTQKWDGTKNTMLSLSTIKQIAGRAGRFSLGQQNSSAGIVTSLNPADLEVIHLALRLPTRPLKRAVVGLNQSQLRRIMQLLPPDSQPSAVYRMLPWFARVPKIMTLTDTNAAVEGAELMENIAGGRLSMDEAWIVMQVPMALRDPVVTDAITALAAGYKQQGTTDLVAVLKNANALWALTEVSGIRKAYDAEGSTVREERGAPHTTAHTLAALESLHRVLIAYLWLTYRLPTAFHEQAKALELKEETELCISFFLRELNYGVPPQHKRPVEDVDEDDLPPEEKYRYDEWVTNKPSRPHYGLARQAPRRARY